MRRKDREVTDIGAILEIIKKCPVARLGMYDGESYIVPMNYGWSYENETLALYFHSALEGRKIDILRVNPRCCFEMDCSYKLVKNPVTCSWTAEYESVVGCGEVSFITDPQEKRSAMDIIVNRYSDGEEPEYDAAALSRILVFKLDVETVTGKRNPVG